MHPFMTLDDGTEIVHSETLPDGRVKVYIEKPDEKDCFHHAICYLPDFEWQDIFGFSESEMERYRDEMERTAHSAPKRPAERNKTFSGTRRFLCLAHCLSYFIRKKQIKFMITTTAIRITSFRFMTHDTSFLKRKNGAELVTLLR